MTRALFNWFGRRRVLVLGGLLLAVGAGALVVNRATRRSRFRCGNENGAWVMREVGSNRAIAAVRTREPSARRWQDDIVLRSVLSSGRSDWYWTQAGPSARIHFYRTYDRLFHEEYLEAGARNVPWMSSGRLVEKAADDGLHSQLSLNP